MTLVGCVFATILIGFGLAERSATASDLSRVNNSLFPAGVTLGQVARHLTGAQAALVSIRSDIGPELQGTQINATRDQVAQAATAWSEFRRLSVALPGEAKLRAEYESTVQRYGVDATTAIGAELGVDPSQTSSIAAADEAAQLQHSLVRLTRLYERKTASVIGAAEDSTRSAIAITGIGGGLALLLFLGAFAVSFGLLRRREAHLATREAHHARESERSRLETNLQRAFEMVQTEEESYEVIGDAIRESVDEFKVELLVADSSRAHFRQVVATEAESHQGCPVGDPRECPATSRTQTLRFTSSSSMPVCPHLRHRPDGPLSAVCVPVSIAGKSVAVLHAMGRDGVTPDPDTVETLSLIGRKSGERLGALRAFARTEAQARTDPLTGLLNRRSLENRVLELIEDSRSYVVAYGDVDHFKQLNDIHGHDAGDRALRLFGRVLRDSVRPSDLPARYGGEEFVIVLPDCTVDGAVAVVERFRERLALLLTDGRVPQYTVSFGVAPSAPDLLFSEAVQRADAALLVAKASGRNRVVTSGQGNAALSEEVPPEVATV